MTLDAPPDDSIVPTGAMSDRVVPIVGKFRTYLPQILASSAKNLLIIDIGLAIAFPTIVIPALRGLQPEKYFDEPIHFTAEQATWYGSLGFVGQPLGSAISGWITEPFGRKRSMMFVNIPHICAWILLYYARSPMEMYVAVVLIGFGTGIMEAPILTYVGEICQPAIRGVLLACTVLAAMLGFLLVYMLGTLTTWRNASLVCLAVPLISVIAICFIPETPYWLLSQNRPDDALKSLQWLRGWVPKEAVAVEFREIQRCSEIGNACALCQKTQTKCDHPAASLMERMADLFQLGTRRPFMLIMMAFFVSQFSGLSSIRPFMVQLFQTFAVPVDPNWGTVYVAIVSIVANVICMCVIKLLGKRKIYLFSLVGCACSCFSLALYAGLYFPPGYSSFDNHSENLPVSAANYVAFCMFLSLAFFTNLGVYPVTFTLLSEVFPFKTRSVATGLVIALSYLYSFTSVKTFLDLEHFFSISGTFILYGSVSLFGFFVMFVFMPETENRTLEEVERYFSDPERRKTDRKIQKIMDSPISDVKSNGSTNGGYDDV